VKIYIAGKITGDPNYRAKFNQYRRLLEISGHTVLNPAVLPSGLSYAEYARIDFAMIDCADVVAFLPDYQDSTGARLELAYCQYICKPVKMLGGL
jgi:hypothetical protein